MRQTVLLRWGRRIDVAIAVALVGLAGVGSLRWLDVTAQPIVVLQTAGPFVGVGLLVLVVATALLRRWWMLLPTGVALVVALTLAVPGFFAHTSPGERPDLTVLEANLDYGRADAGQLMDAVRAHNVDVLVATELTPDAEQALAGAGADRWFRHRVGAPRPRNFTGTMVYSRYPVTEVKGTTAAEEHTPSLQPELVVNVSGTPVRVKAAHPMAPLAGDTDLWRAGLRALYDWRLRQPRGERFLIAGDFNASRGHPAFRALADGLDDAQRTAGLGWVRTWPFVGHRVPPYVALDHLLSSGLAVIDAGQVAIHGTDHALVWASYAVGRT